jgi:diguanylate cyclase (GGDEF)-like protein
MKSLDKKILELRQERQKLLENESKLRDFVEASADWFWETDSDLNVSMVAGNQADFSYQNLNDFRDAYFGNQGDMHATILAHQKFSDYIVQSRDTDGKTTYLRISGKPIFDEDGIFTGYRGSGRDVSEVIALSRRVEYHASHDELTGLPNRALFRQRLEHALLKADRIGQQVLLLFFDLDNFKMINDTLGHDVGDQLLIRAANRIRGKIRSSDVLCRLGGDEFVMIMENASPQDAHRLVREIINAFATPFDLRGQTVYNTMSIGVSVYPDDTRDPEALLLYADLAMYRAKQNGRNDFEFYTADLNYIAHQWLEMEHGLRQALKDRQLYMVYQPQIDIESGALVSLEALLRWKHPERGLIPPLEFIKIAEQSSLINEVGDFVMESVCQQLRTWIDSGNKPSRVSMNISARHLRSAHFRARLAQYLDEYQIPSDMLGIEITEHALLENTDEVKKNMRYIKDTGLYISLDDFGTGHSSLLYLKRWPVDAVKIDQSFVTGLASNQENRGIVKAIIALSQALDLDLVGEGVESQQQSDILIEGGCKVMQGFFYSAPMLHTEVVSWFKH